MWKSLLLGLLVSLHTRIFLVFMRNYEAKSPLFMIKRAGLNYVPRQSHSKNSHGSYILKWILVRFTSILIQIFFNLNRFQHKVRNWNYQLTTNGIVASLDFHFSIHTLCILPLFNNNAVDNQVLSVYTIIVYSKITLGQLNNMKELHGS